MSDVSWKLIFDPDDKKWALICKRERKQLVTNLFDNVVYMDLDITGYWKHNGDFSWGTQENSVHYVYSGTKKDGKYKGKQCLILCDYTGENLSYKPVEGNHSWYSY